MPVAAPVATIEGPVPGLAFMSAGFNIIEMCGRKGRIFSFGAADDLCAGAACKWYTSPEVREYAAFFGTNLHQVQYHGHSERDLFIEVQEETISAERTVSGSMSVKVLAVASLTASTSSTVSVRAFCQIRQIELEIEICGPMPPFSREAIRRRLSTSICSILTTSTLPLRLRN